MDISPIIRQETLADHHAVFQLIEQAFAKMKYSDHQEQFLVERLRKSESFIPELSLVAEINGIVVGHILLTKISIKNEKEQFDALALAPVSVLPAYQGQGIGSALIKTAHAKAMALGHQSIVLIGHEDYYPRFGYVPSHQFDIRVPFEVPAENCMVCELVPKALQAVSGVVEYDPAFFE